MKNCKIILAYAKVQYEEINSDEVKTLFNGTFQPLFISDNTKLLSAVYKEETVLDTVDSIISDVTINNTNNVILYAFDSSKTNDLMIEKIKSLKEYGELYLLPIGSLDLMDILSIIGDYVIKFGSLFENLYQKSNYIKLKYLINFIYGALTNKNDNLSSESGMLSFNQIYSRVLTIKIKSSSILDDYYDGDIDQEEAIKVINKYKKILNAGIKQYEYQEEMNMSDDDYSFILDDIESILSSISYMEMELDDNSLNIDFFEDDVDHVNSRLLDPFEEETIHVSHKIDDPFGDEECSLDTVSFSAISPRKMEKGDYQIIQVVMYEDDSRDVVDKMIKEASFDAPVKETIGARLEIEEGTIVKVVLSSPDIEIEDNEVVLKWNGKYQNFEFDIYIPEEYQKKKILFEAKVYFNDVPATRLKFLADISKDETELNVSRNDIKKAFISYASKDRDLVTYIIQGLRKARPDLDLFFDVETLRSGDKWEECLGKAIDDSDILFLCWSKNASDSKWVEYEWNYALNKKGIEAIEPIPLDDPRSCPPPSKLSSMHFNDTLIYVRK